MNPNSKQKRIAFGYYRNAMNRIEIYEGQASVVKLIFIDYLDGMSITRIKESLESIGIPSPQNNMTWGRQAIANILSNIHYTGIDGYPEIIAKEEYERVQSIKSTKASCKR